MTGWSAILSSFVRCQTGVYTMPGTSRYALSFGTGSLLLREALIAAPLYLRERDWARVRELIKDDNLLQTRTQSSGQRSTREVTQRLSALTDDELELFAEATSSECAHLLWTAVCRRYELVGEFAEEVVRERFLLLTPTLGYNEFDSFLRGKALWHDELDELKDSTRSKLRSTVFRMLVEADLLTRDGRIQPAMLSGRVADALSARTPSDIRFFPTVGGVQ